MSEPASEPMSPRLRATRELASAQSAQCPAKPTERSEGVRCAVLLVHGRSQEMAADADRSDAAVAAYVEGRKREWLAGLARGLTLAGHPPLQPDAVYYPFYGNLLADLITAHERAGTPRTWRRCRSR